MRERPILFSGAMVRAILDGRKTQTRRTVKPQPAAHNGMVNAAYCGRPNSWLPTGSFSDSNPSREYVCPYGQSGDQLYVKEHAWMFCERRPNGVTKTGRQKWHYVPLRAAPVLYCESHPEKPCIDVVHPETGNQWGWRKKLGRFLPKWASRITLEVVSVRVERLQSISNDDACDEGCWDWELTNPRVEPGAKLLIHNNRDASDKFRELWQSINGAASWNENPWVWVVEFRRVQS